MSKCDKEKHERLQSLHTPTFNICLTSLTGPGKLISTVTVSWAVLAAVHRGVAKVSKTAVCESACHHQIKDLNSPNTWDYNQN